MKKVLVTGFDPFGGESINPATESVKQLPDELLGFKLLNVKFLLFLTVVLMFCTPYLMKNNLMR